MIGKINFNLGKKERSQLTAQALDALTADPSTTISQETVCELNRIPIISIDPQRVNPISDNYLNIKINQLQQQLDNAADERAVSKQLIEQLRSDITVLKQRMDLLAAPTSLAACDCCCQNGFQSHQMTTIDSGQCLCPSCLSQLRG